jgi:colanic acid biosynthesis glycosyl transferase WcaI
MRLLIIGINYAPEPAGNAPYTSGFAEHMAVRGHEVHVVTGMPHYPSWRKSPGRDWENGDGLRNGVHVHRRWHYVPSNPSALRRALYETSFLGSGASLLSLPRPDAIVGVVPILSDGVLARIASRRFGAPYGLIFQDLMGQAAKQSGVAGGGAVGGLVSAGEGWIARGAAAVAIAAEGFREYVQLLGVPAEKIVRVRNWNHTPSKSAIASHVRERLGWQEDSFVCLHAGNMGHKQGLTAVIECARMAGNDRHQPMFVLAGDGSQRQELERKVSQYGLTNVRFLPTQSSQDYADLLGAADVLILNQSATVKDMSFPSKVASYVASGRPVVAAVAPDSAVARELEEAGAALVVEPGQADKLLAAISRLTDDELLRRRLVAAAGRYSRLFSPEIALQGLESFTERICGRVDQEWEKEPLERAA